MKKLIRLIEFFSLFAILPVLYYFRLIDFPIIPSLLFAAAFCFAIHYKAKHPILWKIRPIPNDLYLRFAIFAISSVVLLVFVKNFQPDSLFYFPTKKPLIWGLVIILYPILSVLPQEFIYKTFFFERYKCLFPNSFSMIFANVVAFSFLHIVFRNWLAVTLTFLGGILFATNYEKNKSLFWVSVEHYLYGAMIFTIGLGQYFYEAAFKG